MESIFGEEFYDTDEKEEEIPEGSPRVAMVPDNSKSWTWRLLIDLFMFGDRFDAPQFRRDVMDVVTSKLQRDEYLAPRECIKYAFSNLPSHSQLTQFFINDYGYNGFLFVGLHELPMDFLVGVMRIMMGRTPLRQCKGCYSKAKAENAWQGLNAAALAKGRDRDPFEHDRRFYHEHGSDEERQACKGERRKVRESRKKENSEPKTDLGNDTDSDHTDSENENEN